ncbi:MAG: trypsin-like peptidase domain-containing protein [Lachnospiraceae bacterium]|nr:trypsin-like peptidase domain-containing protein [Lachnospiraceae bacterium]
MYDEYTNTTGNATEGTDNNNVVGNDGTYRVNYRSQGTYAQSHPEYYNGVYGSGMTYGNVSVDTTAKKKKPMSTFGKICLGAVIGIIFGICAGGGFLAVQQGSRLLGITTQSQSSTVAATQTGRNSYTAVKESNEKKSSELEQVASIPSSTTVASTVVTDVTKVVEKVMPSIVSITNKGSYNYYYYTVPSESSGSGIIMGSNDEELLIVTNYHVVADNDSLSVAFADGSEAEALIKGSDSSRDLAVIAVRLEDISDSTIGNIKIAAMGDSESLKVGEPAIAIGNALGYGQSVTTGVISAVNREMEMENTKGTFIQTDAAINPGNSGGALLNINGEVIGINSNKIGGTSVEGMGYAIPISAAKPIIEELMQKTTRTLVDEDDRGFLGITGATLTQQEMMLYGYPEGVYVANVNDGSAADQGGLQKGDFITAFDGESVTSMEGLQRMLMYYSAGDEIEVEIMRPSGNSYKEMTLTITLGDKSVLGRTN